MSRATERAIAPLLLPEPPWIVGVKAEPNTLTAQLTRAGLVVRTCDGGRMRGQRGFIAELVDVFALPEAEPNLDGLLDWMRDLDWLGPAAGYALLITNRRHFLAATKADERANLEGCLHDIAQYWAEPLINHDRWDRGPMPFHTVLLR